MVHLFTRFTTTVRMTLTSSMDAMGTKTLLCSVVIRMSPGSLPNRPNSQGAKRRTSPSATRITPATISRRAIDTKTSPNGAGVRRAGPYLAPCVAGWSSESEPVSNVVGHAVAGVAAPY